MSKKRYICEVDKSFDIFDNLYKEYPSMQEICRRLNKQSQRIAELEEQLKNAIVPKFKQGDKCYAIIDTMAYRDVFPVVIGHTHLLYDVWDGQDATKQHYTRIFATKEEAQAKLEELQGEKK